jgi:hypothetical protein
MPGKPALPVTLAFVADGVVPVEVPVTVDWIPAVEWLRLRAVRQGADPAAALEAPWQLEPRWDTEHGAPRLGGVRVRVAVEGNGHPIEEAEVPLGFFAERARSAAAALVKDGKLPAEGNVSWYAVAPRDQPVPAAPSPSRPKGRAVAPRLAIERRGLVEALAQTAAMGEQHPDDVPVLVPDAVLREVAALTLERAGQETGGVLIGHLRRDHASPELFLEVTAQIPARDAVGDEGHLEFSPQVWSDVRAALELRRRQELMVGWWHSHPVREWCKNCAEEKRATCALAEGFFSSADRRLHRIVFPRAYSVALVASDTGRGAPGMALFGWRAGQIERRGFHLMREDTRDVA